MQVIETVATLRSQVKSWKQQGEVIALVPTMGNLHAGHLSLVKKAQQKADKVVVSIFVNPLQFGPNEDFDRYPRTFAEDCQQLAAISVDAVFAPTVEEMYPSGQQQTQVCAPQNLTGLLEGASRPGHFDGVTTVVAKLFQMVQPDLAVFGQKDFQQWRILQQMVTDLAMPVEILRAPIARDEYGLALSSRNQYLSESQQKIAPALYQCLQTLAQQIKQGVADFRGLEASASQQLLQEGFDQVDYVQVVDVETLLPATAENRNKAILVVARLGQTRLLDNVIL